MVELTMQLPIEQIEHILIMLKAQVHEQMTADQTRNPWIAQAGRFANDPTWDDFLAAMAAYRGRLDHGQ